MSKQHKQTKSKRLAWATLAMAAALGMGQGLAEQAKCGTLYASTNKGSKTIYGFDATLPVFTAPQQPAYSIVDNKISGLGPLGLDPYGNFIYLDRDFSSKVGGVFNSATGAAPTNFSTPYPYNFGSGTGSDNYGNTYFTIVGGNGSTKMSTLYKIPKGSTSPAPVGTFYLPTDAPAGGDIAVAPNGNFYYVTTKSKGFPFSSGSSFIYNMIINGSSVTLSNEMFIGMNVSGLAFDNQGNAYTTTGSSSANFNILNRIVFNKDYTAVTSMTDINALSRLNLNSGGVYDLASCVASTITVNKALYNNDPINRIDTDQFTVSVRDGNAIVNSPSGSYVDEAGKTVNYNSTSDTDTANPIKGMSDYKKLNPFDSNATTITGTTGMYQFVGPIGKSYNIGETMKGGGAIVDYKSSLYCQNRLPFGKGGTAVAYLNGDVTSTIRTNGNIVLPALAAWDGFVCNFVNKPTTLAVSKIVDNTAGGTSKAADWTLTAASDNTKQTTLSANGTIAKIAVRKGTYTISEKYNGTNAALASNYSPTYACTANKVDLLTGASTTSTVKGTQSGSGINTTYQFVVGDGKDVAIGDDVTCTVTNKYTPPVVNNPPLACKTNMYALLGDGDSIYRTIAPISLPAGAVGTTVATVPLLPGNNFNAALAISNDGTKVFVPRTDGALEIYDVTSGTWTTSSDSANLNGERLFRATVSYNNMGYMGVRDQLWIFQTSAPYDITKPITLKIANPPSGKTPTTSGGTDDLPPSLSGSGDFFSDTNGNIYLTVNPSTGNKNPPNKPFSDTFVIRPQSDDSYKTYFLGRIYDNKFTSGALNGFAVINQQIYAGTQDGRILNLDIATPKLTRTLDEDSARSSSDLASCDFATFAPNIISNKTVTKVDPTTGNNSATPITVGDTIKYTITVSNTGNITALETKFQDSIPTGTTYVADSTTLNGTKVNDIAGAMPFSPAAGAYIKSAGEGDGILRVNTNGDKAATITFKVKINSGATSISNQGVVTYLDNPPGGVKTDDPGTPTPNDPTIVTVSPKIALKKYVLNTSISGEKYKFTGSGLPGNVLQYCIAYYSSGGDAKNFTITDVFPDNTKDWKSFIYIPSSNTPDGTVPSNPAANPNDAAPVISPSNPDWTTLDINTRPTGTASWPSGVTYDQVDLPVKDANGNTVQKPGIALAFGTTLLPGNSKGAICFDATIK